MVRGEALLPTGWLLILCPFVALAAFVFVAAMTQADFTEDDD